MPDLLLLERALWRRGIVSIAGVDEAGRGALFGPVVAGAVILNRSRDLSGYRDSKSLSEPRREKLFDRLVRDGHRWAAGYSNAAAIDRTNIRLATMRAMERAVSGLIPAPQWVLVDGNDYPALLYGGEALVRGDSRSSSVAAASIVAKVVRDRIVRILASRFPGYGLERNKGYGTAEHLDALRRLGPTPLHRKTFRRVVMGKV